MQLRWLVLLLAATPMAAQVLPDVSCVLEDYPVKTVVAWQFPQVQNKVQVVVLKDPDREQEARFDLTHGASLISLRYKGKETLFGQSSGASVSLFSVRKSDSSELKGVSPYWSAFSPDQGGSSMGAPATTTGIACNGQQSLRAFATMEDRGADSSFQKGALLGVVAGRISNNFPPGYSTPFIIETNASWAPNPSGEPKYYLRLEQTVVNARPNKSGSLEWYLNLAAPWRDAHAVSYPAQCTDKHPCASDRIGALATGRYEDAQQRNGIAMVVPTAGWQTDQAYVRPVAEYVVLLYNAVWAAPRYTFASVLRHPLDGVGSHRFVWYICTGSWSAVQQFAASQPVVDSEAPAAPPPLPAFKSTQEPVTIACEETEFKPQPDQIDHAVVLRDPAGEQTVLFDTTQGGAIVSWKYQGREHIWGWNGGGLMQMAFHRQMGNGAWTGDYNPTQAGDGSANSQVTGIACEGKHKVDLMTTMLDFNHNNSFYSKPLVAVWNGRVNDMIPQSYSSPYILETRADWIPNPAGSPHYYLRLRERLVHVAREKIGALNFDFAAYMPWQFHVRAVSPDNCPCSAEQTTYMAGGWYSDFSRKHGLAVAMPSSNFPGQRVSGGFNSDYMWRNHSFHLGADYAVDGIGAKEFVWYGMVGSWESAANFSQQLK